LLVLATFFLWVKNHSQLWDHVKIFLILLLQNSFDLIYVNKFSQADLRH
jgi:hypothetical protein